MIFSIFLQLNEDDDIGAYHDLDSDDDEGPQINADPSHFHMEVVDDY